MGEVALYQRLLRLARPYWLHFAGLFALGVLASPIALLTPVPLKLVVDSDRKSTRLNSSHANISYAVFCLKKKK